jgi:hypothetical protein
MTGMRQRRRRVATAVDDWAEAGGRDSIFMAALFLFDGIAAE